MTHVTFRATEEEKKQYAEIVEMDGRDLTEIIKSYLKNLYSRLSK